MKFIPKELNDNVNVNVSHKSPLKEFFLLLAALLGIILLIYIGLGFAVDLIVPNMPPEIEDKLGRMYTGFYKSKADESLEPAEVEIQNVLNGLVEYLPTQQDYKVYLIPTPRPNALALPGGNIVITTALFEEIESENELAYILAHELGHFANRDHLRGLGRGLVFFVISTALFGADSSASQFVQNALLNAEMKFSQQQEPKADLFALELLNKRYGHVGGATDFFQKISEKEKGARFLYFFSSHPLSENRVKTLEQRITQQGYVLGESIPLNQTLKTIKQRNEK